MGRERAGPGQSPSTSRWDPCPADSSLPPLLQLLSPIPPPPTELLGSAPTGKKNAQFVMSCPAVNLPLPSHREDLLSSIYLFATWTMEGLRPAELFIITPPTIQPPPTPAAPAEELQVSAGINPCGAPGSLEKGQPLPGRQPARAAAGAGRSPVLGSHGKSPPSTKREQREKPADNHRSGKLIVPLRGCLARGKNGAVQPPREFRRGGGPRAWHSHCGHGDT